MTERTEIRMSGKCHGLLLIQEGSRVTLLDMYRRRPKQEWNCKDENAAFEALCGLRNELRLENGE